MVDVKVLSFPEFQEFLADTLEIRSSALTRDASFLRDLAVESLKLVETIVRIESDLNIAIPLESAWRIETVGDAYNCYLKESGAQEPVS
jgi:acyl carrier protein